MSESSKSENKYLFNEHEETSCVVCSHVVKGGKPILFASRDEDDEVWQFLCGEENHEESEAMILNLKEVTDIDTTVNDVADLPVGCGAERTHIGAKWQGFRFEEE